MTSRTKYSALSPKQTSTRLPRLEKALATPKSSLCRCRLNEVCNPHQAKRVLEADGAISIALPCRISVFGTPEHYTLATMRPTEMMKGFASPEVEPVAREGKRSEFPSSRRSLTQVSMSG